MDEAVERTERRDMMAVCFVGPFAGHTVTDM